MINPIEKVKSIGIDHRRIVRGVLFVAFFILIGKVASAAKEIVIANRFGTSELVDVYVLVFTFAMWIPGISIAVFNTIYIPLIHRLDPKKKEEFKQQFTGATLILAGIVTLLMLAILPPAMEHLSAPYSLEAKIALKQLSIFLAPLAGLGLLTAQLSTMLLADERHANTLLEVIPPLGLILLIVLWPINNSIDPLLWGTLLGTSLQLLGLFILLKNSSTFPRPTISFSSPGWREFRQNIGIVLLAQLVWSFIEPISSVIASQLGAGSVSSLGYSTRILALFLTLGATAVGRAILPVLSNTERTISQRIRLAEQWAYFLLSIGTIAAVATWLITPQLVKILLERGAFSASDTAAVSQAIRFGVAQFPFYFAGIIFAQLYITLGLHRIVLYSAILAVITKTFFSLVLAPYYSFAGIVLATVPMYLATTSLFFFSTIQVKRKLRNGQAL